MQSISYKLEMSIFVLNVMIFSWQNGRVLSVFVCLLHFFYSLECIPPLITRVSPVMYDA